MNGSTTAASARRRAHASARRGRPGAERRAPRRRASAARMPSRITRRLDAQAPPICPSITSGEHPAVGERRDAEAAHQREGRVRDPGEDADLRAQDQQQRRDRSAGRRRIAAKLPRDRQPGGSSGAARGAVSRSRGSGGGEQRRGRRGEAPEHRLPAPAAGELRAGERRGDRHDAEDDGDARRACAPPARARTGRARSSARSPRRSTWRGPGRGAPAATRGDRLDRAPPPARRRA